MVKKTRVTLYTSKRTGQTLFKFDGKVYEQKTFSRVSLCNDCSGNCRSGTIRNAVHSKRILDREFREVKDLNDLAYQGRANDLYV